MNARAVLGSVLVCFASLAAAALAVIPPWQNPDEPQHLHAVRLLLEHGPDFVVEDHFDDPGEAAIVESMARHRWWEHYGEPTPTPVPTTFATGPSLVVDAYFGAPGGGSRLYYRGVAGLFRATGLRGLLPQLYAMRALSVLWAILTVAAIWAGTRVFLDERAATVLAGMTALHPQFVLVSTTASPDALVNLSGAVVWWQAAAVLTGPVRVANVAALIAAATLGFLTRRMGATLLVAAAAVVLVAALRSILHRRGDAAWVLAPAAFLIAGVAALALGWADDLRRAIDWVQFDPVQAVGRIDITSDGFLRFLEILFATFWLSAGWLRHAAPLWWQAVTVVLVVVAVAGLLTGRWWRTAAPATVVAAGMVTLQAAVVVIFYMGVVGTGAQGRYLFPVLPAALCLLWVGWCSAVGPRHQRTAALVLVSVFAFLNVTAWTFVLLPAYA